MMSVWGRESAWKKTVSKRYHQNFLICNTIKISNYCMHCRFIKQFLWRSVCSCIFQGNVATNYRWSGKFNYCNSERIIKIGHYLRKLCSNEQELSYRKQIAHQVCTQFVEGISVTLKSTLRVTEGQWKRNHWTDHTRLTIRRVTGRWILSWPWNVGQRSLKVSEISAIRKLGCMFPIRLL